ncbi:MAG: Transcriptional regulatory protein [Micrococcaceae bacterium]|jgi:response regulator of citrate/malate metabolism|uniref:Transcriptional regulatory protein n=1 Tax=Arthrobacter cheniae TaxID=1258888 RepID=A0A3A5MAP5_9MICC|nr:MULTISPECIES: response regulator [Arthrobacter]MCU1631848.1 Transcriptional regulatory protein [Micrococcaceae bacterium]MEC5199991.1 response regulator of citrate/malate metabolism [Arthrobacter sp. PL16]RJT79301.1 response regulator [Arthrobacter cheniae]
MSAIRVLVVEDDPVAADAHAEYIRRLAGFELAGVARSGAELAAFLQLAGELTSRTETPVDLMLLDMNLPDAHGLDIIRRVRGLGLPLDIIAITAVRDLQVVRAAISSGIVQYLIKPFTYSAFSEKLGAYQDFRQSLVEQASATTQAEVDQAFASLRPATAAALPKGLSAETLRAVSGLLKELHAPTSAIEVSEALSMSRVTARRYLEHLADQQSVLRTSRYGTRGRPEFEYSWARSPTDR